MDKKDLIDYWVETSNPDYKQNFYKKCDNEFTATNIKKVKELRTWLLSMINEK